MERKPRRPGGHKPGGLSFPFANIEWVIANHGSITIGEVGADIGCVAAAADQDLCYAMLARRDEESLLELMGRLDRAIEQAAESSTRSTRSIRQAASNRPQKASQDGLELTVTMLTL